MIKSVIHQRSFDAHRLSLVRALTLKTRLGDRSLTSTRRPQLANHGPRISLFLSHDWPEGIDEHGDLQELCSRHKAAASWRRSGPNQRFGSPPLMTLMRDLTPEQWCAGHMHAKFEAYVKHPSGGREQPKSDARQTETACLALGKPAMGHEFLEVRGWLQSIFTAHWKAR